jgi:catechol 2,3-dioxygenase-like lactoylglutathione lyase family enzyme
MLGRFLEVSIPVTDILASIEFYEKLGFTQTATGESWPHPYAVLGDGRLFLGLHQSALDGITLTFVQPDLAHHVARLRALGLTFSEEHLDSETFNQVSFADPAGQRVRLVEARTFSPPPAEAARESVCGYFTEFGIPVREFEPAVAYWEALGFVGLDGTEQPFPRRTLTSERLNLGLYRTRALRHPVIAFEDADMKQRLELLRLRDIPLVDEMPDALDAGENAVLLAPEGTRLLLMNAEQPTSVP